MKRFKPGRRSSIVLVFGLVFGASLAIGAAYGLAVPASAAPAQQATQTPAVAPAETPAVGTYVGPSVCTACHADIVKAWKDSRHAQAFSSPIFQQNWTKLGSQFNCLQCHTTGSDPTTGKYAVEGVTCESCHGPFIQGHPQTPMPVKPDASLCATCHKSTTDEWRASKHGAAGINCQACHNPHSQGPLADSVTALCTTCHKDQGSGFTHSTHANAGLQCSDCHMYTPPQTGAPIGGLVATGHTFSVGSDACIKCHQDTVHTRSKILQLQGEVTQQGTVDPQALKQQIAEQDAKIAALQSSNANRLYTGLAQGAIVGLLVGGVAAWIVSRRLKIIEVEEEEGDEQEKEG